MSEAVFTAAASKPAGAQSGTFLGALLALSALPALFFACLQGPFFDSPALAEIGNRGALLGTAHVGLTGFFWLDSRYRDHIHTRPGYFYAFPAAVAACCIGAVYLTGMDGLAVYLIGYHVWAYHHFGRQNWGILCLAAAGTKSGPVSFAERLLCRWAPFAGVCGYVATSPLIARHAWADPLWLAGFAAALGIAAGALLLAARQALRGAHPLRFAMTAMVGLFFLPAYLVPENGGAAIGTAHAYQYALIMGYLAAGRAGSGSRPWILPLAVLSLIYLLLYAVVDAMARDGGSVGAILTVAWFSLTVWHFIADADLWRLSRPFQRAAVRESLPFLFRH